MGQLLADEETGRGGVRRSVAMAVGRHCSEPVCGQPSKTGNVGVAARWGPGNSAGRRWLNLFRIQIPTDFKQNLNPSNFDRSKKDLPELNFFKQNMVVKVLKNGATFSIVTYSDLK
jgi:hypothetical protein